MSDSNKKRVTKEEVKKLKGETKWGKLVMEEKLNNNKNKTKKPYLVVALRPEKLRFFCGASL